MSKFFRQLPEQYITDEFDGILVLGDVHGVLQPLYDAIKYANFHNLYIVSLGDLVDYGPQSKEVVLAMQLQVKHKLASIVLGNHEKKLQKYFVQKRAGDVRVKIKDSLQASIDSFDTEESIDAFMELHDNMNHVLRFKNVYFTHGALDRSVIDNNDQYTPMGYQLSLFGEVDKVTPMRENGFPNRVFNWVDTIPEEVRVYVGHDIRSSEAPVIQGNATFLDTGSGKEGVLHGAVLDNDGTFLTFVNFGRGE